MPTKELSQIRDEISGALIAILGLEPSTELDHDQPMTELGLDSMAAMDLIVALEEKFEVRLRDTAHLDHPTVGDLATHIRSSMK